MEDRTSRTPIGDLANSARAHYDKISANASCWLSIIPQAINAWELQRRANKRLHLAAFGVTIDLFVRIGEGN